MRTRTQRAFWPEIQVQNLKGHAAADAKNSVHVHQCRAKVASSGMLEGSTELHRVLHQRCALQLNALLVTARGSCYLLVSSSASMRWLCKHDRLQQ